jgi:hypothetical protein
MTKREDNKKPLNQNIMKIPKLLLATVLASLAFAGVASAQTAIYISGAPATRAIWNQSIFNTLVAKSTGSPTITKYWSGSAYNTANQIILTGGNIGGTAVTIYGSWTGSTGGNQSVANTPPATISALKVGFLLLSASTPGGSNTNLTNTQYPQVNLSDTQQATVPFNGTTSVTSPTTSYVALTEAGTHPSPAVTGFEFLTNKGAPASLNNITTNQAQNLFTSTGLPLAQWSGAVGDQGTFVYPVGRDIASGARYILLAETGIGVGNNSQLIQFEPTVSGGALTDIGDNFAPGGTINLITFPLGNGGYPSFSNVLTDLEATSTPAVGYIVTYVTDSDAIASAIPNGAQPLSWNGVPYSVAGIQQGVYTYWSYLHVYYNNTSNYISTNFPTAKTFADDLDADLAVDTNYSAGTAAILTSSLAVSRLTDGGLVTVNY